MDEIECITSGGSSMAKDQHQSTEQSSSSRREMPHPPQPEDGLKIKIDEELRRFRQNDDSGNWDQLCIYRIPKHLLVSRDTNNDAPYFFSLGPYQTQPRFQDMNQMNQHKWRGLNRMLERTRHNVKQYLDPMRKLKERALACYEGPLNLKHPDASTMNENDPFVEMMMLDGCFILEMLQGFSVGFDKLGYSEFEPVFTTRRFGCFIGLDIIRLENQIPLFVLSRLLGIQLGKSDYENGEVSKYAVNFFKSFLLTLVPSRSDHTSSDEDQAGMHLLDVLRSSIVGSQPATQRSSPKDLLSTQVGQVHCVTDLLKAGVKFKKGDDKDKFLDVKFKNGVFTIPRICIDNATNSVLFNLIVYEQCHFECSNHITCFASLMDGLINSAQDVSYLRRKGIIKHMLGSDEEVANLFNCLGKEVVVDYDNGYLAPLTKDMNEYYPRRCKTWLAILKRRYLDNPWTIISVVAAVVLLLLTAAQTFYAVYAYYKAS